MQRHKLCLSLGIVLFAFSPLLSQSPNANELSVSPRRAAIVTSGTPRAAPIKAGALFGPIMCDERGGVYVRVADPRADILAAPLVKIGDGEVRRFDLSAVPGLEGRKVNSFAITVDTAGRVHAVARYAHRKVEQQYLLTFDGDGQFIRKVQLDHSLDVYQLAALPTQTFLVAGLRRNPRDKAGSVEAAKRMFAAILDSDGKVVQEIKDSRDISIEVEGSPPVAVNPAIQWGRVTAGADGNIYFLKPGKEHFVDVIASNGEVLRSHKPWKPFDDAEAGDLYVTPGRFFIRFQQPPSDSRNDEDFRVDLVEYHSVSFEPLAVFDIRRLRGQIGCIDKDSITVLTVSPDGNLGLLKTDLP